MSSTGSRVAPRQGPAFSAIVGQERMKLALLLSAVDPLIGGVLIRGQRGTAKSTLARALAEVLPRRRVVAACPYQCQPALGDLCDGCRSRVERGEPLTLDDRPTSIVDLPLGASEDRVVGTIDMEVALRAGTAAFQPGVLAEANGQILYVDEVNLLDHHLVDVLLDAAASGRNTVEREGISASHPSQFILVGTMNPEEGELRPQLLDRFGLCVDVEGLRDPAARVRVMELDQDPGPGGDDEERLRGRVAAARARLKALTLPRSLVGVAARLSLDQQVLGHRADLVMVRAARALAALREPPGPAGEVCLADLLEVAELALVHRRRAQGAWSPAAVQDLEAPAAAPVDPSAERAPGRTEEGGGEVGDQEQEATPGAAQGQPAAGDQGPTGSAGPVAPPAPAEVEVEERFEAGKLQLPRERRRRSGRGRRSQTSSADRRGRYVGSRWEERTTDLALDATLRAAAPHQLERRARSEEEMGRAIHLERQDLRQKVRQRRIGNLIVFLVDASASMDAEQRMDATRSAVLALLQEAYVRRDRVAMISFAGRNARVVLRPTGSVDLAERQLTRLAVGGTTPLTHGMAAALELILAERRRDPEVLPLLVLISDGRGNISLHGDEPLREAQAAAEEIRRERVPTIVIDTSREQPGRSQGTGAPFAGYGFNACFDLSRRLGGEYFALFDVSEQGILRPVAEALRRRG